MNYYDLDTNLFLDIDLSILGACRFEYETYAYEVRDKYEANARRNITSALKEWRYRLKPNLFLIFKNLKFHIHRCGHCNRLYRRQRYCCKAEISNFRQRC